MYLLEKLNPNWTIYKELAFNRGEYNDKGEDFTRSCLLAFLPKVIRKLPMGTGMWEELLRFHFFIPI